MVKDIITYISSFFDVGRTFGLVEQYRDKESIYPAYYCNSGEFKHVEFDQYKSLTYHRLNGTITRVEIEAFGCEDAITETYPMKVILYCPKDCDTDDSYSVISKVNELANDIKAIDLNDLRKANNLLDLKIEIGATNPDSFLVWGGEFEGNRPNRANDYVLPSTHMMVCVEYNLIIIGTASCLATSANTTHIYKFCGIKDTLDSDPEYCFIDTLA